MTTEKEVEALIREHSTETGSLTQALQRVHELLLTPDTRSCAVDVFPPHRLAGAIGQLCRCRGMIQEVQPEVHLFCASRQHFFSPSSSSSPSAEDSVEFMDAVSLYVIPVPGNEHFYTLDDAACTTEAACVTSPVQTHADRKRRDRGLSEDVAASAANYAATTAHCDEVEGPRDGKMARTADDGRATAVSSTVNASASAAPPLNFPHPPVDPRLRAACIVTVLLLPAAPSSRETVDRRRNPFRVNDVIDFFGFQHFPDDQLPVNEEDDFARFSAWNASELSKGLVSRLLCMAYSPVSSVHLTTSLSQHGDAADTAASIAHQRRAALQYLCAHLTSGDELAAEYVLLHLCARVTAHSDALPVGDVPLLLTAPNVCATEWSRQLRRIVPVGEVFLSGDALRTAQARLTPQYNNELNFLQSGVLQVANGSHVTVDCTALGTQDGAWYEGVFALVHKQLLLLEYPYQTLELPVDVAVLALIATSDIATLHPLFQLALCVHWQPASPPSLSLEERDAAQSPSHAADAVREYFTAVRSLPARPDAVDEDVSTQASAALLAMARDIPGWNNRDPLLHNNSFSAATALMRAHAASWGRTNFTAADIAAVQRLEGTRVARLSNSSM